MTYVDSSAFVKTVIVEPESAALRAFLAGRPEMVSSALLRTEAIRAIRHEGPESIEQARRSIDGTHLVDVSDDILDMAGRLEPRVMRSLDAIHLATALALGDELDVVVTYDERMTEGAQLLGLPVAAPS